MDSIVEKMNPRWKSNLSNNIKINFFRAAVETVPLYGSTPWTLTQVLDKQMDGTYTKMLDVVKNTTRQQQMKFHSED